MPTFELEEIKSVNGKIKFFDLIINGVNQQENFTQRISTNKQFLSEYRTIISYMNHVANLGSIPGAKYHKFSGIMEKFHEHEFKTKHLRVYTFHLPDKGKIVVYWGFKSNQKEDMDIFRSLKNQYLRKI